MSGYRIMREVYIDEYGGHGAPQYFIQELKLSYFWSLVKFRKEERWYYVMHEGYSTRRASNQVRTSFPTKRQAESFIKKLKEGVKTQARIQEIVKEINS